MFDTVQDKTPVFDQSDGQARTRRRNEAAARMAEQAKRGELPLKTLIVRPGASIGEPEVVAYFKWGERGVIEAAYIGRDLVQIRMVLDAPFHSVLTTWDVIEDIHALKLEAQVLLREIERCTQAAFGADYARWSPHSPDPLTHLYGIQEG